jgi:RsiW-degrading membrane proteinase PrsW (M82 family)
MLNIGLLILASIGPGLLWLWYFYRQDRFEPEPASQIFKVFGMGVLLVIPAGLLEQIWRPQLMAAVRDGNWINYLVMTFLVVALIEEGLKTGFLLWLVGWNKQLNEPADGIIYGITLGLGFASLENFLWASVYGYGVAALRAIVTTLAHASFTGWMGYFIAKHKLDAGASGAVLWWGFLLAWASHGLYDFLLFLQNPVSSFLAFVLIAVLLWSLYRSLHRQVAESPFRE